MDTGTSVQTVSGAERVMCQRYRDIMLNSTLTWLPWPHRRRTPWGSVIGWEPARERVSARVWGGTHVKHLDVPEVAFGEAEEARGVVAEDEAREVAAAARARHQHTQRRQCDGARLTMRVVSKSWSSWSVHMAGWVGPLTALVDVEEPVDNVLGGGQHAWGKGGDRDAHCGSDCRRLRRTRSTQGVWGRKHRCSSENMSG